MKIPKDIPPHYADHFRDGYRAGYRGEPWQLPLDTSEAEMQKFQTIPNYLLKRLDANAPAAKAYMRGYQTGKSKFQSLKGGVGV